MAIAEAYAALKLVITKAYDYADAEGVIAKAEQVFKDEVVKFEADVLPRLTSLEERLEAIASHAALSVPPLASTPAPVASVAPTAAGEQFAVDDAERAVIKEGAAAFEQAIAQLEAAAPPPPVAPNPAPLVATHAAVASAELPDAHPALTAALQAALPKTD